MNKIISNHVHCLSDFSINGRVIPSDGRLTACETSLTFGQTVDKIEQTLINNGFSPLRMNEAGGKVRLSNIHGCGANANWNIGLMTSVVVML